MPKIVHTCLYFVAHGAPTDAHFADAEAIETAHRVNVKFRNGTVPGSGAPELTDFVAGDPVPVEYLKYPRQTPEGVTHAEQPADFTTNIDSGDETNAGEKPVLSDLASEIGSAGGSAPTNGGWGAPKA